MGHDFRDKLKACPFCGGDAIRTFKIGEVKTLYTIKCIQCEVYVNDISKGKVVEKWNNRVDSSSFQGVRPISNEVRDAIAKAIDASEFVQKNPWPWSKVIHCGRPNTIEIRGYDKPVDDTE